MARNNSVGLRILAVLALAALPEVSCCHLGARALPPTVVCGAEGRLPDPTDCRYYMDCTRNSNGSYTPTISMCPDGTYYDSCKGDCSRTQQPDNCPATCDNEGIPTVSTDNPSVYVVCRLDGENWILSVTKCPDGNAFDVANGCTGDPVDCPINSGTSLKCNTTGYFGDEKDCSIYYYCSGPNATPDQGVCGNGQYFNPSIHNCDTFKCTEEGYFADPVSCSSYYRCDAALNMQHIACNNGERYDNVSKGCLSGDCTTVCPGSSSNTGSGIVCNSSGLFPDPLDCSSYYNCDSSQQGTHEQCPAGNHFDSAVGACLVGDCSNTGTNFTCPSTGFFADPSNCSSYYYCNSSLQATHIDCPPGGHFDSSVGGCLIGGCTNTGTNFTCTSTGFFADPFNCSSYYYCNSSLQATHIDCPPGGHFDSSVGGCLIGSCTNRLVATGLEAEVQPQHSITSLPLQREEAMIPVRSSHKRTLQLPSA